MTDTQTQETRIYVNPSGSLASVADTSAFPLGASGVTVPARKILAPLERVESTPPRRVRPLATAACAATSTALCLNGSRFQVQIAWRVPSQGTSGVGTAVTLTGDTGYFWFFSANNVEVVIKAVDGRAVNNKFWVFYGALSNVEYTITVTDTQTGVVKTYQNPSGQLATVADTSAF